MSNGQAQSKGGAIYSGGDGITTIIFQNCGSTISSFSAESTTDGYGGFLYIDNPDTSFSSSNCNYDNTYAKF